MLQERRWRVNTLVWNDPATFKAAATADDYKNLMPQIGAFCRAVVATDIEVNEGCGFLITTSSKMAQKQIYSAMSSFVRQNSQTAGRLMTVVEESAAMQPADYTTLVRQRGAGESVILVAHARGSFTEGANIPVKGLAVVGLPYGAFAEGEDKQGENYEDMVVCVRQAMGRVIRGPDDKGYCLASIIRTIRMQCRDPVSVESNGNAMIPTNLMNRRAPPLQNEHEPYYHSEQIQTGFKPGERVPPIVSRRVNT